MNRSRTLHVPFLLLFFTLMTFYFLGSTFAKYTSSARLTGFASVAKWDIQVLNHKLTAEEKSITVDLFSTLDDTLGGSETDVDLSQKVIAPGTQGSFDLEIQNNSQVNAQYTISFSDNKYTCNIPLEYQVIPTGSTPSPQGWEKDISKCDIGALGIKKLPFETSKNSVEYTVHWRWPFSDLSNTVQGDKADTLLAISDTPASAEVTATITVTQLD